MRQAEFFRDIRCSKNANFVLDFSAHRV